MSIPGRGEMSIVAKSLFFGEKQGDGVRQPRFPQAIHTPFPHGGMMGYTGKGVLQAIEKTCKY
ncbi:MAG: hypothetical protein A3A44_01680 [Candidatus Sungbacteria bacterium RIFCSPLOWO2_01_FULL_60_25]|uniref:Uncharacterized protein n=1 Tax=Candidatus Sungbacteria bacterium RIFCSPLOWO2_01_FULL_60_25 TaxID=1802281 RepID=A0A1G2LH36_9BACT|nr:MAG: hypothetical protein A3A44_01680 [Candidatus Sungbacteria bacterium RIFCSPLOWO2_01_FULL_60_25]